MVAIARNSWVDCRCRGQAQQDDHKKAERGVHDVEGLQREVDKACLLNWVLPQVFVIHTVPAIIYSTLGGPMEVEQNEEHDRDGLRG